MKELKDMREKALVNVKETIEQNVEAVQDAYAWMMRFACRARKEGLLILEYDAGFVPKDLPLCNHITELAYRVSDGTAPDFIAELMTVRFLSNHYTGIEALLFYVYTRCMLMIQAGENPVRIEDFFNAIVSGTGMVFSKKHTMMVEAEKQKVEEWQNALSPKAKQHLLNIAKQLQGLSADEWKRIVSSDGFYGFDKVLPFLDVETQALVKCYMNEYRYYSIMRMPEFAQEQELFALSEELEEVILHFRNQENRTGILDGVLQYSDKEMQFLLRHVDNRSLAVALKGVKTEVAECFYRNLSCYLRHIVQEDMEYMGPLRLRDIEAEQDKIAQIAKNVLGK